MTDFKVNFIDALPDDAARLQQGDTHYLNFCVHYELKNVADTLTGIVYKKTLSDDFVCSHFNDPKGNSRKVIALKNKLKPGVFDGLKKILFVLSADQRVQQEYEYPLDDDALIFISKETFARAIHE